MSVTTDARQSLVDRLVTQFTSVLKYDTMDVHGSSYVSIGIPKWTLTRWDQGYGIETIDFPIHCYTMIDTADTVLAYVDANFHKMLTALGADRTIGGDAPSTTVDEDVDVAYLRTESGQLYAVITFMVTVTPFPNVA